MGPRAEHGDDTLGAGQRPAEPRLWARVEKDEDDTLRVEKEPRALPCLWAVVPKDDTLGAEQALRARQGDDSLGSMGQRHSAAPEVSGDPAW